MASVTLAKSVGELRERVAVLRTSAAATIPDPLAIFEAGGAETEPWQRAVLTSTSSRLVLLCCRQAGKSSLAAAIAVHSALAEPGSLALLISATQVQAGELLRRCRDAYHAIGGGVVSADALTLQRMELANRSRIVALPGANDASIRGYTARTVVLDEAARIGDPLYYAALPMLATTHGRLLLLSSAYSKLGFFHAVWTEGGAAWERHSVTGEQCPHIPASVLEEARANMPTQWYQREWLNIFSDSQDSVFAYDIVMGALRPDVAPLFPIGPSGEENGLCLTSFAV